MMSRPVFAALVAILLVVPGVSRSEPSNYDECILDAMKGVSSDVAARAIIESCRRLFPEMPEKAPAAAVASGAAAATAASAPKASTAQPPQAPAASGAAAAAPVPAPAPQQGSSSRVVRELSSEELDKLEYRGNFLGTTYRVKVYNGNKHLSLTEVTIAVWDKDDIDRLETYRTAVDIEPLDEGIAKYTVVYQGQEETWAWKLIGAKGAQ